MLIQDFIRRPAAQADWFKNLPDFVKEPARYLLDIHSLTESIDRAIKKATHPQHCSYIKMANYLLQNSLAQAELSPLKKLLEENHLIYRSIPDVNDTNNLRAANYHQRSNQLPNADGYYDVTDPSNHFQSENLINQISSAEQDEILLTRILLLIGLTVPEYAFNTQTHPGLSLLQLIHQSEPISELDQEVKAKLTAVHNETSSKINDCAREYFRKFSSTVSTHRRTIAKHQAFLAGQQLLLNAAMSLDTPMVTDVMHGNRHSPNDLNFADHLTQMINCPGQLWVDNTENSVGAMNAYSSAGTLMGSIQNYLTYELDYCHTLPSLSGRQDAANSVKKLQTAIENGWQSVPPAIQQQALALVTSHLNLITVMNDEVNFVLNGIEVPRAKNHVEQPLKINITPTLLMACERALSSTILKECKTPVAIEESLSRLRLKFENCHITTDPLMASETVGCSNREDQTWEESLLYSTMQQPKANTSDALDLLIPTAIKKDPENTMNFIKVWQHSFSQLPQHIASKIINLSLERPVHPINLLLTRKKPRL